MTTSLKMSLVLKRGLSFHNFLNITPNFLGNTGVHQRGIFTNAVCYYKHKTLYPMMKEMNRRRENIASDELLRTGKEKRTRRSDFIDWNYNSELVAFQARLGEKFDDSKLREAFITADFVEAETKRQEELQIKAQGENQLSQLLSSNQNLAAEGSRLIDQTLSAYVRWALPYLPEEGVRAFKNFLTQDQLLAYVSFHIGTMDLVLTVDYPPSPHTMRQVFEAIIGALASSNEDGPSRASRLVLDLVATQLHGKDLTDIWDIPNPMKVLSTIMANENRGEPEARLLWASGKETLLACYHVGIYSDKQLIGQAPGESTEIAEEMAARDALKRVFRFDETASKPLPFGRDTKQMKAKDSNLTIEEWQSKNVTSV